MKERALVLFILLNFCFELEFVVGSDGVVEVRAQSLLLLFPSILQ
jgi:hypothetical protein